MQEVEISPGEKKFARDDVRLDHLGVDVLPVDHLQNILAYRGCHKVEITFLKYWSIHEQRPLIIPYPENFCLFLTLLLKIPNHMR